jgi:molybdopterin molybdotransferase
MLTLEEALTRLLNAVQPSTEVESIATFDALGRVLGEDVRSALDVPPADNTSMDGYAVRCRRRG